MFTAQRTDSAGPIIKNLVAQTALSISSTTSGCRVRGHAVDGDRGLATGASATLKP